MLDASVVGEEYRRVVRILLTGCLSINKGSGIKAKDGRTHDLLDARTILAQSKSRVGETVR
jgi:hypothetical protein